MSACLFVRMRAYKREIERCVCGAMYVHEIDDALKGYWERETERECVCVLAGVGGIMYGAP